MESSDGTTTDVVHPEVRAHVNSLVSAVSSFRYVPFASKKTDRDM